MVRAPALQAQSKPLASPSKASTNHYVASAYGNLFFTAVYRTFSCFLFLMAKEAAKVDEVHRVDAAAKSRETAGCTKKLQPYC